MNGQEHHEENSTADCLARRSRNRNFRPRMTLITRMGKSATENDQRQDGVGRIPITDNLSPTNDLHSTPKKSSQTFAIFHDSSAENTDEEY